MKRINFLIIAVLAGVFSFFTSCTKDDPAVLNSPTITFGSFATEVDSGTIVTIVGDIKAEGEIAEVTFFKGDDSYGDILTDDFNSDTTHSFSVIIPEDEVTETFVFAVQVKDNQDSPKITRKEVTITVSTDPVVTGTLKTHTNVVIGDQGDTDDGSFLDLLTGNIYTYDTAEENAAYIDLAYYWGSVGNASIYSPAGMVAAGITTPGNIGNWSTRTTTLYYLGTGDDYDDATYASVAAGFETITTQEVTQVAAGNTIYFKTDSGRCGIIKVGSVVPAKGTLEITFSYKVQDENPS